MLEHVRSGLLYNNVDNEGFCEERFAVTSDGLLENNKDVAEG